MTVIQKLLNKINGLHYSQEYLCLSKETLENPLHVYLVTHGQPRKDITESHLFVGYSPLIFAFPSSVINNKQESLNIIFSGKPYQPNEIPAKKDAIALLSLKKIDQAEVNEETILFYEGVKGRHHFISKFHQFIIQVHNRLYNKKAGNIFLKDNLYKQVQIAYSIARKICLVTVGDDNLYNLFPTDLHGKINDQQYIISLRHNGRACQQVGASKRIVISDMQSSDYKTVYALGKNHTKELKKLAQFDFDAARSRHFSLPLPKSHLSYKELQLEGSFIHGIHKILLFKIIHEENFSGESETLSHVHNCYATWRYNQGLSSNFLYR